VPKRIQQLLAFGFGVVFVIVLLVIAVMFPEPKPFQYEVFKVVLALAAAGVAAMIPGFLHFEISTWLRAGGALAVFAVVYFKTPALLVVPVPGPEPTAMFPIVLACRTPDGVRLNKFSFPFSDIKKNANYPEFIALVGKLPGQECDQIGSKIFRLKDEVQVLPSNDLSVISDGNLGVIVVPTGVIAALGGDDHLAFTKINSESKARATQSQ
jgi:hypothetical protein